MPPKYNIAPIKRQMPQPTPKTARSRHRPPFPSTDTPSPKPSFLPAKAGTHTPVILTLSPPSHHPHPADRLRPFHTAIPSKGSPTFPRIPTVAPSPRRTLPPHSPVVPAQARTHSLRRHSHPSLLSRHPLARHSASTPPSFRQKPKPSNFIHPILTLPLHSPLLTLKQKRPSPSLLRERGAISRPPGKRSGLSAYQTIRFQQLPPALHVRLRLLPPSATSSTSSVTRTQ